MGDDGDSARQACDLDDWRGAVRGALLRFEVECARPGEFHGTVSRRGLGDTALVAMTSRPHRAVRAAEHIASGERADYLLSLQLAGRAEFLQDSRCAALSPGDMVFYDSTRPVEIRSGEGYRSLCFRFPRSALAPGRTAELTATVLGGAHGLSPALAGLLTGLHASLERPVPERRAAHDAVLATAHQAVDLVATLLDDELARRGLAAADDPREALRERADRHIDEHLADPELSPRTIAAALFVSTRQLHGVFADADRTVAATVRRRRLERCLADLADPRHAATPVSAIATRWGFANATRFGQLVKRETGATPSAYRRTVLGRT